jgi:hypothetical protein
MFAGRTKILTIFALLGFVIGTTAYFVFNWFVTHNLIKITAISIIDILLSPWFVSGLAGAILAITILAVFAHISK